MEGSVLSVHELTTYIKKKLESSFSFVSVQGEVSNLRKQASGHIYFTLKDQDAQISCALFRASASRQSQIPKDGDKLIVHGELSVYAPRGGYQIIVRQVEFSGTGQLLLKLHERKRKLELKGWFDQATKKPLPSMPKTIGVVTSPTGSVIQDILHVLARRFPGFHLILNPVRVQGTEAAQEIAQAIQEFNTYKLADVLIIGRGGGSIEDLWPFNEECVAEAIFSSQIPIVSAVGHETDFTIADLIADLRAPTPSAAAEMVIPEKREHALHLSKAKLRIAQSLRGKLQTQKRILDTLAKQRALSSPYAILEKFEQKVDEIHEDLTHSAQGILQTQKMRLDSLKKQQELLSPISQIGARRQRLLQLTSHLRSIDPRRLLKKGYSIIFHEKKDSVILSTGDVEDREMIRIRLSDGEIRAQVKE